MIAFYVIGEIAGIESFHETGVQLLLLAVGVLSAVIGGYVAASIAFDERIRHALYLGGLLIVLWILLFLFSNSEWPLWFQIVYIATALPSAWIGGIVRDRRAD